MSWSFDSKSDREMLARKSVSMSLSTITQITGLFMRDYDRAEMAQAAGFIAEVKEKMNVALDEKIKEYQEGSTKA